MKDEILREIKESFNYLFDEHFFSVKSLEMRGGMSGWIITLVSPAFQLSLHEFKGEIHLYISPIPNDFVEECWIGLYTVISYLREELILGRPRLPKARSVQLSNLSRDLRFYYDHIVDLFEAENFARNREQMLLVNNERTKASFDALIKVNNKEQNTSNT